jgi:hypothetical protein
MNQFILSTYRQLEVALVQLWRRYRSIRQDSLSVWAGWKLKIAISLGSMMDIGYD